LQYAHETTVFDPALYPRVPGQLSQSEGYLQGTQVAVLSCYRDSDDWASQADPWAALGSLLTRAEAEFSGRLLIGPDDVARCLDDPDGLCWAVLGVEGFDALVRTSTDVDRLPGLFERGVRLFQPTYSPTSVLAGSSAAGDDRGLTDLGRAFLETLCRLTVDAGGPRPMLDLAHLNPRSASDVLDWFETEPTRASRVIPVYSHGALADDEFHSPRAITADNLRRLRALGGVVGFSVVPFYSTIDQLRAGIEAAAEIPYLGRAGYEGIAIGTDFLGADQTLPGLGTVAGVVSWIASTFDPTTATALIRDNAFALLSRAAGVPANDKLPA
jgi:membrane dipeptidase